MVVCRGREVWMIVVVMTTGRAQAADEQVQPEADDERARDEAEPGEQLLRHDVVRGEQRL